MKVFLDTEFTDFQRHGLISLALVGEDGREFYAERNDFHRDDCSAFVVESVLPLLGRVPGAACNRVELAMRLHEWFNLLPVPATVVFEFFGDWLLLVDACGVDHPTPPVNLGPQLQVPLRVQNNREFLIAHDGTFTRKWPPHHALADARALRAGYLAWERMVAPTGGST